MKEKLNCILLIDDDEPTNFLNRMTLEQIDCARYIKVVQSGQEALNFLMQTTPDLIFLDINMPAMDGWEFLEKYRQLPSAQKASIVMIMLTTSLNPDDEQKALSIPEVNGFENKPLKADRLKEILEAYFPGKI
jgi:CheY-like chemotaxis protein